MKKIFLILSLGLGMLVMASLPSCKPDPVEGEERLTYVYTQQISDPPDDFMILFNTLSVGQKVAKMTTGDSAVWLIERISDGRQTVSIKNDTGFYNLNFQDTVGLFGNTYYEIVVTTFPYGESKDVYVGFRKLPLDFSAFNPKF